MEKASITDSLRSLQEQVNCMEFALAAILKDVKILKGFNTTQVTFNHHVFDQLDGLEVKAKPSNKDAIEMRKAASMLYARAKQLEAE